MSTDKEADAFDAIAKKKVEAVVKISKDYDYPEYGKAFWDKHPMGVISLIVDIFTDLLKAKKKNL